jgi:SAM-dependent methyltransferase
MDELPFSENAYDVLWAEGAIYNMGFQNGIENWKRFLKPGGILVASEITWLTHERPHEIQAHWDQEYPEIDVASAKIGQLEAAGYSPIGYFTLPESCWLENYYAPLKAGFEAFLKRNDHAVAAQEIVSAELAEIELYEKFKAFYSYGVYIARKT